jgi:cytosine permease
MSQETALTKQSCFQLSSVQIGGAICLPVILIGYELVRRTGLTSALVAIIIGNLLLTGLALITSKMSVENRKTTAENAEEYFGKMGKVFFALIICLSLSCWFAIQTEVMSQDIVALLGLKREAMPIVSFGLSLMMVASLFFGIQGVTLLATCTLPLMIVALGLSLYFAKIGSSLPIELGSYNFGGLSLVMAATISAVCDLPTFFRHAATKNEALKASYITFLVAIPLVEIVGVLLGYWTESNSLTEALLCVNHPLFGIFVGLFILVAGWTTNNTNLYSAAMSMQSILPKLTEKKSTAVVGIFAILLSLCPLLERLSFVLDFMGVFIASMTGVVLTAYMLKRFELHETCQKMALFLGIVAGLSNLYLGGLFTSIAILDALFFSAFTLVLLRILFAQIGTKDVVYE